MYPLSLHDALPVSGFGVCGAVCCAWIAFAATTKSSTVNRHVKSRIGEGPQPAWISPRRPIPAAPLHKSFILSYDVNRFIARQPSQPQGIERLAWLACRYPNRQEIQFQDLLRSEERRGREPCK